MTRLGLLLLCTHLTLGVSVASAQIIRGGSGGGSQGLDDVIAIDRTYGAATSQATAARFGSSAAGVYVAIGYDVTLGPFMTCEVAGVLHDCNPTFKLLSGRSLTITNASDVALFTVVNNTSLITLGGQLVTSGLGIEFTESDTNPTCAAGNYGIYADTSENKLKKCQNGTATDLVPSTLTNTTFDTEATGNVFTYKKYKWIPAGVCQNTTPSTPWDLPTASPAVAACRTGTNTTKGVLDFADGSSLTAQYNEYLNEDWTGAIDATIIYEANSTSTNNTVWKLAIACAGDADADDPAFTDDEFTADAGKATAHQYNATAANTITTTGTCAAGDMMHIRVKRDATHASDNLAATARLVGVSLKLREAQ